MRILKWGIIVTGVVVLAAFIAGYLYLRSTLPDYDRSITLPGVGQEVEIIRDSFGMAHIRAASDADAYFAMGYCQAQDRLFQMDLVRRAGQGRLAEILGPPLVKVDKLYRTLTALIPLEKWYSQITPQTRAALDAYAEGVNAFLESGATSLPVEFTVLGYRPEPWQPIDTLAVMVYMGWSQNYAFKTELLRAAISEKVGKPMADELFIDYPTGAPAIIPEGENPMGAVAPQYLQTMQLAGDLLGISGGASNGWVVAPRKSANGGALFANDPHLNLTTPSIWYEGHMTTPSMNVSGAMVAGIPFVIAGANDHVAWGVTNSHYDDADFYIEKLDPDNPLAYRYKDHWEPMRTVKEKIRVKGAATVDFDIRLTRHGVIIDDIGPHAPKPGYAVAMRWSQVDFPEVMKGFWLVNRAATIEEVETAAGYAKSGQNWIYADDRGNIGCYFLGGIPRRVGFSGELPVPGWEGAFEWQGYVPDREQPHLKNPAQGYIVNANNKVEPKGYPHVIAKYYATPDRYIRIAEMIEEKETLNSRDFETMQADLLMVMAREWVPLIIRSVAREPLSATEKAALATLVNWDFTARHELAAPAVFNVFTTFLAENTFKKRLGETLYNYYVTDDKNIPFNVLREIIARGDSPWLDDPDTPEKEGIGQVVAASFKDAVAYLAKTLGNDVSGWQWGQLHTLTIHHPFGRKSALLGKFFNLGPFPADGSLFTVNPTYFKVSQSYAVKGGGASFRHIIDFKDMENSKRILPGGISGNVMSPHYDDQLTLWRNREYRPFVLDRKAVLADARYRMVISPAR